MAATIKLKKSSVPGKVPLPSDLAYGELAVNYTDGRLYFKDSANQVRSFNASTDTPEDHSALSGLLNDDHPQYVHADLNRIITAQHTFNPTALAAPFTIGENAAGQLVPGLNTELLDGQPGSYYYSPGNNPVITERYVFNDALEWIVKHNKNTDKFVETLTDASGSRFFAKVQIIDLNTFKIKLTAAISGTVDVLFTSVLNP